MAGRGLDTEFVALSNISPPSADKQPLSEKKRSCTGNILWRKTNARAVKCGVEKSPRPSCLPTRINRGDARARGEAKGGFVDAGGEASEKLSNFHRAIYGRSRQLRLLSVTSIK